MTVTVRPSPEYGWREDGKSAAEIAVDLEHTRYRLDADIHALKAKLSRPARLAAIVTAVAVTLLTYLIRRRRR